ncbi:MAG: hypothetical protein HZB50_15085 [Chloroflexi bacterium]|nr:hypothetical protein [Chloroflexota bacterium]
MNKRRNPFENSETIPAEFNPPNIYESIRVASPHKRNRQWEKNHLYLKAVYRGVDPKLALQVKAIAGDLMVPEGEVARAVLEYALQAYADGRLNLNPRPNPTRMRMTLFPTTATFRNFESETRPKKRKQADALWRVIVTWRGFSIELKKELAVLASEEGLNVPVGELITALLRYGLKAYDSGLLALNPVQKRTSFTLALEGTK